MNCKNCNEKIPDKDILRTASQIRAKKSHKVQREKYGKKYSEEMRRRRVEGFKKRQEKLRADGLLKGGQSY